MLFKRMKKSIAVFLCAVMLICSLSALSLVSVFAEGTNLVTNGDFSNGLENWSPLWPDCLSITESGDYAIEGNTLCIKTYTGASQIINVEKNKTYSIRATFKTTVANAVKIKVFAGVMTNPSNAESDNASGVIAQTSVAPQTWTKTTSQTIEFNSGDNTQITLYFVNRGGNSAWVDNVTMEEVIIGEIINGDFSNGLENWSPLWPNCLSITESGDYAIEGNTLCIKTYTGASQVIRVEKNKIYSISATFKTTVANAVKIKVFAGVMTNSGNAESDNASGLIAQTTVAPQTWTNTTNKNIVFNSGDNTQITLYFVNRGGNNAWVDNVRITEIKELANGDFEGNTVEPWVGSGIAITPDTLKINGNYSLRIPKDGGSARQTIRLEPNSMYAFNASVMTTSTNGMYVRVYEGTAINAEKMISSAGIQSETWANNPRFKLYDTFVTGDSEIFTVEIYNRNGNIGTIDDITITKLDATVNESLVNGDFETGDKTGWIMSAGTQIYNGGDYTINDYALQLQYGDAAIQYVKVKPNTAYSFHALVRLAGVGQSKALKMMALSGATVLGSSEYNIASGFESVHQYHNAIARDFVFVSDNTGIVKLMIQNDRRQLAFIDDISLTEVPATLVNGDFENGLDGWNPASSGYPDTEGSVFSNTIIDSGDYAINGKTVQFGKEGAISQIIKVTPNTVYGFSALARTSSNPYISVVIYGGSDFSTELTRSSIDVSTHTDTPKTLESVFNSGSNSYVKIAIRNGSTTNAAWIDDLSILAQESASPITFAGTSILYRLFNDAQGLRFAYEIPDKGENFNMCGKTYTVVSSGTLVGLTENFGDVDAVTALSVGSSLSKDCANNRTYIQKDGKIVYTALITGIAGGYEYSTFAARAYLVAQDAEGNTRIFYGDVIESDLGAAYQSMPEADKALVDDDAIIW